MVTLSVFDQTAVALGAYQERLAETPGANVRDPDNYTAPHSPVEIGTIIASSPGHDLACLPVFAPLHISMSFNVRRNEQVNLVASIYNYMGLIVVSRITPLESATATSLLEARFKFTKLRLAPGPYRMNFAIRRDSEILSWRRNALQFTVTGTETETYIYREDVDIIVIEPVSP
jgi:Wzt C-terminal domain